MSKIDENCIFCKIAAGKIQASKIFENESFICIRDIHPQAKVHFLVMPKEHVRSLAEAFPAVGDSRSELIGQLFAVATQVAREQGLLPNGFRSVVNTNRDAGQTVDHVHLHVLGGEELHGTFA